MIKPFVYDTHKTCMLIIHDFIDPRDFPDCWLNLDIAVEVEAKELVVLKLKKHIDTP